MSGSARTHKVVKGDTLEGIAKKSGIRDWKPFGRTRRTSR